MLIKEKKAQEGGVPAEGQGSFWGHIWANIFINNLKENSDGMLNMLTDVWICSWYILMIKNIPCSYLT